LVLESYKYYPFGLQTANSWTRANTTGNNFLYNSGTELNTTSQVYDLEYRNYDPALGRMNQVDPMASKYSSLTPYNYSFNDPVTFNDPSGADPHDDWMAEQNALQQWFNNTMPLPMDPGGGGSAGGGSAYYNSMMGGYGNSGWHNAAYGQHLGDLMAQWNPDFNGPVQYTNALGETHSAFPSQLAWAQKQTGTPYSGTIEYDRNELEAYRLYVSNGVVEGYDRLATPALMKKMNIIAGLSGWIGMQEKGPLFIDGMILNTDNPNLYSPFAYFNYTLTTGEGGVVIYSGNSVRLISIDGKGNLADVTSKSGPAIDLKKYTSNTGFYQLPRENSRSSLEEAMGKNYADKFWQVFINGNGYFMTDKPFSAIGSYLNDSPYSDTTFRFRFDVNNFNSHNYNVVLNVYYGR
jgi:RHS repeat-associated protein